MHTLGAILVWMHLYVSWAICLFGALEDRLADDDIACAMRWTFEQRDVKLVYLEQSCPRVLGVFQLSPFSSPPRFFLLS